MVAWEDSESGWACVFPCAARGWLTEEVSPRSVESQSGWEW